MNADEGLGTVPATAYGANQAVWDANMNTPASVNLLSQAKVGMMRYPGGSYGDGYHWQTGTMTGDGYVAPGTGFDSFMGTVKSTGSQAILIANYGSGTPQEAADWVRYANVTKGYHDQYWEIGNEVLGNGYYGADWELDNHASKSPTTYATNPVDTTLTAPGNPSSADVTADGATINWQPSTGGTATRYEVYQQLGTHSVLLGESTSTSFTAHNLRPGTSYTLNVLATDQRGFLSAPSAPVTFITGTPQHSTCAVSYSPGLGWDSGFVSNISITDTGPAPITGWTLAFSFPIRH